MLIIEEEYPSLNYQWSQDCFGLQSLGISSLFNQPRNDLLTLTIPGKAESIEPVKKVRSLTAEP